MGKLTGKEHQSFKGAKCVSFGPIAKNSLKNLNIRAATVMNKPEKSRI